MCGIAGFVDKSGTISADAKRRLVESMALLMQHRGPDDFGSWVSPDGRVALAHRRLSVIDLSPGGHQPMISESGTSAIVFNGELYNFHALRDDLVSRGATFRSHSDTEVVLAGVDQWSLDALPKLDAMFALAHYDSRTRRLLLARDAFGEKPLYFVDTPAYFAFSSELSALTKVPGFDSTIVADAVAAYLSFQYVPAPRTIYRSACKLLPGHWATLDGSGRLSHGRHFSFNTSSSRVGSRAIDDMADELEEILVETIRRRVISDVPLGAFLSGGVDSGTVAAIATQKLGMNLSTFSIGFEGHKDSEHFEAAQVARRLGTSHRDRVLDTNVMDLAQHIGTVLDEPNGDTSCLPTFLLSKFAREHVTVALSGDGGDEMFGGYGRHLVTVEESERRLAGDESLAWWTPGAVYLSSRILVFPDDVLRQLIDPIPRDLSTMLSSMRSSLDADDRPLINVLRELDASQYMPGAVLAKVDRMSMQHSLEVRAPFLGLDVARFAAKLAANECYGNGQGKLVLKRVASRYLPADWIQRPKRGFGLPTDLWSKDQLLPRLKEIIQPADCRLSAWIEHAALRKYLASLEQEFHAYRAWSIFILETWLRSHPATA